ncbi:endoribonuclease CG2145-like isoform X2 [Diprion similis]|uniref:endoribonuclease CG2145-like isoform X2 n=1 Tax=Diprion similis TaxID=362088 RepID=UPI001EF88CAD|nr:endoribonuclease CG2145-like isoform X2 [Diprion similis]
MELKFHILIFVVLIVAFAGIDAKGGRFRGSSSRGRSSHSSSWSRPSSSSHSSSWSRPSSTSHSTSWSRPSSTSHTSTWSRPSSPSHSSSTTNHKIGSTGSFLNAERRPGSATVNHPSSSDPFRGASAPTSGHGGNTNNSPFRPFGTVPPPRQTVSNTNNSPFRPFGTVPPAPAHGHNRPVTPPPPGFVIPPRHTTPKAPTYTKPTSRPVSRPPYHNYRNSTPNHGSSPPGFRQNITSMGGVNYPRQPPVYHPTQTYLQPQTAYPQGHGNIQPIHNHIYPQQGPVLPPNPAPTYVIVPGQQSYSSGRQTGDIFKEALIHAGVNAAVHRLTAPSYYDHYHQNSWNSYGVPPSPRGSSVTTTHIVNNYYDQGPGGAPMNGGGGGGSNLPPNYPAQSYPGSFSGGSQPAPPPSVGYPAGNTGSNVNSGSQGTFVSPGNTNSGLPSNGISSPTQDNGRGQSYPTQYWPMSVSDEELWNITEKLFSMDENNAQKYITLNLQNKTTANNTNITDASPQPLFNIQPEAYQIPTIRAIRSLYKAASEVENKTRENSRKEETLLIDLLLNTNVMSATMGFLEKKNLMGSYYSEQKESLKHIWFTTYDGSSSGFKRVFQGEIIPGEGLYGIQDWIAFDFLEKSGRANYLSYTEKLELGKAPQTASILKINYEMSGFKKTGSSLLIGTSPELELALYTICHYARPNNYCNIALGGTRMMLYTHTFRYFGADLIDLGLPIV